MKYKLSLPLFLQVGRRKKEGRLSNLPKGMCRAGSEPGSWAWALNWVTHTPTVSWPAQSHHHAAPREGQRAGSCSHSQSPGGCGRRREGMKLTPPRPQVLELPEQPGGIPAELSALHCLAAAAALPLHHHLLPPGDAALWGEVQLWWDADPEEHLRQLPTVPPHRVSGMDLSLPGIKWCKLQPWWLIEFTWQICHQLKFNYILIYNLTFTYGI